MQAEQADQRSRADRHQAAGDFEPPGAHLEVEAGEEGHEDRMAGALMAAGDRHATDIDDFAPGFDDQSTHLLGREGTGWQHETACRNGPVAVPSEDMNRPVVVFILFAACGQVSPGVMPALVHDRFMSQAVGGVTLGVVGCERETISGLVENPVCESVE
jgi:hypothetical protein